MVLIVSISRRTFRMVSEVSVPLRGLWFLSKEKSRKKVVAMKYGFRPLAGIMALIGIMIYLNNDGTDCFRPLTGIMVLIKFKTIK